MKRTSFFALVAIAVLATSTWIAFATPPVATPRRVVCISAGNDGFLSGCEGYYRGLPAKSEPNVVQVGGDLAACMAQARKGDQLIVVAHGAPGQFTWDRSKALGSDTTYFGYGDGTNNTFPVPPNLRGTNSVRCSLVSCHSNEDPAGEEISVVQSLRDVMNGGGGQNNVVSGYDRRVESDIRWGVKGFRRVTQRDSAELNLDVNRAWMDNPPTNRPGAPPPDTHSEAAAAQLNGKPEYQGKDLTVNINYGHPVEEDPGNFAQQGIGPFCEGVHGVPGGVDGDVPVPAVSAPVIAALSTLLAGGAAVALRRRRAPAKQRFAGPAE